MLPKIPKKETKVQLLMCINVYDDITGFEVCGFAKNTKIQI